jgi:integrase
MSRKLVMYVYLRRRRGRNAGKVYCGRWRLPGDSGPVHDVSLHTTDKRVAKQRLGVIVREAELERAGLLVPKPLQEAAVRPLTEHVAEYQADLLARGRCRGHVDRVGYRLSALMSACGWKQARDVTRESFTAWRAGVVGKSGKTLNEYLAAISGLLKWMKEQGRVVGDPLSGGGLRVRTRGRETYRRRALSDEEVGRLLTVSGPRRLLYLIAVWTGLRRGELKQLQWSDVHLDMEGPYIVLRAAWTKNRKGGVQPLHAELADALRVAPRVGSCVVRVPDYATVQADFERAGLPWGTGVDGDRVDFHALRHTYVTRLGRAGVDPGMRRLLARHSEQRMTDAVYLDARGMATAEALAQVPWICGDARIDSLDSDAERQAGARRDTDESVATGRKPGRSKGLRHDGSRGGTTGQGVEKNSPSRTRTYNNPVNSRVLYH